MDVTIARLLWQWDAFHINHVKYCEENRLELMSIFSSTKLFTGLQRRVANGLGLNGGKFLRGNCTVRKGNLWIINFAEFNKTSLRISPILLSIFVLFTKKYSISKPQSVINKHCTPTQTHKHTHTQSPHHNYQFVALSGRSWYHITVLAAHLFCVSMSMSSDWEKLSSALPNLFDNLKLSTW